MRQYETFELTLKGPRPAESWVSVDLNGVFENPAEGDRVEVKGFYAGDGNYKIRFYPEKTGLWKYTISGLANASGEEICEPAAKDRHGMVRADATHFRYADGSWFYPFGTTVYAFSHQEDSLIEETFKTLMSAPFNKIRMCVFPKHYEFNHNEPPYFAFEKTDGKWDVNRPCFAFWDRIESHIRRLDQMGIQCDLILFHPYDRWGFEHLTREEATVYLDYLTRRLSAFPNVWWSLANEYDLLPYKMDDWKYFARFLHENDVYWHLLSNHEMVVPWDYSNPDTTHICHQTSDLDNLSAEIKKYQKPLMVDECKYEGNISNRWGNISGFELTHRFWVVCMQGGYCTHGETFLNDTETLWWSKGGKLVGESPARIGFLRQILESLPGPLSFGSFDVDEEEFCRRKGAYAQAEEQTDSMRLFMSLTFEQAKDLLGSGRELLGTCGTDAYIKYYGKQCCAAGTMELPADAKYDVEVIDIWEMTRTKKLCGVSGKVKVDLPGKEGIAVMARKING